MTSAPLTWLAVATTILAGSIAGGGANGQGQGDLGLIKGGSTPLSIQGLQILNSLGCPLLVRPSESERQPMWIPPAQVAAKNRLGCLSPSDAVYGPDGCPRQLCRTTDGTIPLPNNARGSSDAERL
ncbi:MAG: hypothetical protein RLZZ459_1052 [Cyanobacteriota bacterium]|jgi:hypothetical protein